MSFVCPCPSAHRHKSTPACPARCASTVQPIARTAPTEVESSCQVQRSQLRAGGVLCFRDENCTHIRRLPRAPSLRCKNADAGQKMSQDLQGLASDTTLTIPDSKILLRAQEGSPNSQTESSPHVLVTSGPAVPAFRLASETERRRELPKCWALGVTHSCERNHCRNAACARIQHCLQLPKQLSERGRKEGQEAVRAQPWRSLCISSCRQSRRKAAQNDLQQKNHETVAS